MDAGTYTSCGEEVPLGVECALPCCAGARMHDDAVAGRDAFPSREIENFAAWLLMIPEVRTVAN